MAGGLSTGLKKPVNPQMMLTVAVSVAALPKASVTLTATVRVEGALSAAAENVADWPGVSKVPSLSRSQAKVTAVPSGSVPVALRVTELPSTTRVRATGVSGGRGEAEADDHRVVVRRAVGVRLVQGVLGRRLEGGVVVEHVGLVAVDVPVRGTGHLGEHAGVREGMVEIARLPIERVRVGVRPQEVRDEVGVVVSRAGGVVGTRLDGVDRVLHRVRVEVAQDQEVGIAAPGRIGREPVHERLGGQPCGCRCSCPGRRRRRDRRRRCRPSPWT